MESEEPVAPQDSTESTESTDEEQEAPKIIRRLGVTPHEREDYNPEENPGACPDVFQVEGGLLIIGEDVTGLAQYAQQLPTDASVGPSERLVFIADEVARPALKEYLS